MCFIALQIRNEILCFCQLLDKSMCHKWVLTFAIYGVSGQYFKPQSKIPTVADNTWPSATTDYYHFSSRYLYFFLESGNLIMCVENFKFVQISIKWSNKNLNNKVNRNKHLYLSQEAWYYLNLSVNHSCSTTNFQMFQFLTIKMIKTFAIVSETVNYLTPVFLSMCLRHVQN